MKVKVDCCDIDIDIIYYITTTRLLPSRLCLVVNLLRKARKKYAIAPVVLPTLNIPKHVPQVCDNTDADDQESGPFIINPFNSRRKMKPKPQRKEKTRLN